MTITCKPICKDLNDRPIRFVLGLASVCWQFCQRPATAKLNNNCVKGLTAMIAKKGMKIARAMKAQKRMLQCSGTLAFQPMMLRNEVQPRKVVCAFWYESTHTCLQTHRIYIYFFRRHIFVFVFIHWCAKLVQKRLKTKPSSTTHTSLNQTGACWWETVWIAHRMTTNDVSKHDGMPAQDVQPHLKWPL